MQHARSGAGVCFAKQHGCSGTRIAGVHLQVGDARQIAGTVTRQGSGSLGNGLPPPQPPPTSQPSAPAAGTAGAVRMAPSMHGMHRAGSQQLAGVQGLQRGGSAQLSAQALPAQQAPALRG